jgi:Integrase core domain
MMMSSAFSAKRSARSNDSWVVDFVVPDAPRIMHLIVVDAGARSALLFEPVQNSGPARVGEILESAFERLGPPAKIVTDKAEEFSDDSFRSLLASFGVQHVVASFVDRLSKDSVLRLVRSNPKAKSRRDSPSLVGRLFQS